MDDGTDDGTDGWKGRPPPSQPDKTKDIIYKDIIEFSLKSSGLHPVFTPYPLFESGPQSKEVLLNLGMKCWNLAFNAQGSR
jgi:hypothetical protein